MKNVPKILLLLFLILTMFFAFLRPFSGAISPEPTATSIDSIETLEAVVTEPSIPPTEAPTEPIKEMVYFNQDISFKYDYIVSEGIMPYALYTPSTADEFEEIPLIVWLHGSGEKNVGEDIFKNAGLPYVLNNWKLEGFNAYIICPHLTYPYNNGAWNNEQSQLYLKAVLDKFIETHNVDRNKIILTGHSLGAQGALYMAQIMPNYFAAMAPLSSYSPHTEIVNVEIPVKCFVGTIDCGEDDVSYYYTIGDVATVYGEDAIVVLPSSHAKLPYDAFNLDANENNRSDLIEWMFEQAESNANLKY